MKRKVICYIPTWDWKITYWHSTECSSHHQGEHFHPDDNCIQLKRWQVIFKAQVATDNLPLHPMTSASNLLPYNLRGGVALISSSAKVQEHGYLTLYPGLFHLAFWPRYEAAHFRFWVLAVLVQSFVPNKQGCRGVDRFHISLWASMAACMIACSATRITNY